MQRPGVAVVEAFIGRLDGVDVADQVGHTDIRGGELFHVAFRAVHPRDGRIVATGFHHGTALLGDRRHGVFGKRCTGQHRHPLVEQVGQAAGNAGLGLPAQAKEVHAVAGKQGALHIGQHRVVVADDAFKQGRTGLDALHQVGADFRGNGARGIAGSAQGAKGLDVGGM